MCLYPKFIFNKRYTNNAKNGGNIPPIKDIRTLYVPIGCQKCVECRKQKAREWQVRLLEDIKTNRNGKFVTLTFNNKSIKELRARLPKDIKGYTLDNAIATLSVRLFLERHRKKTKTSIRHWLVTELGHNGTENIHLHGIIWTDDDLNEIEKTWGYGFVWKGTNKNGKIINYVNQSTVNYITKYVHKIDEKHTEYKSKILCSKGIGKNYTTSIKGDWNINSFKDSETNETYRTNTGHKISLPIYWRNKIYTEDQREKLWINKLNKQIRWIRGEKYDISKDKTSFIKALDWHRTINKELGYGDGSINYNQKEYEEQLRQLNFEKRVNEVYKQINTLNNLRLQLI